MSIFTQQCWTCVDTNVLQEVFTFKFSLLVWSPLQYDVVVTVTGRKVPLEDYAQLSFIDTTHSAWWKNKMDAASLWCALVPFNVPINATEPRCCISVTLVWGWHPVAGPETRITADTVPEDRQRCWQRSDWLLQIDCVWLVWCIWLSGNIYWMPNMLSF